MIEQLLEVIPVWPAALPGAELWRDAGPELERPRWENSRLVRNISQPTLTVFLPDPAIANGTGVIVCPGGAFPFLMVDKEGAEVAAWLNARGVAVFVLKYRVFPTDDDDEAFLRIASDPLPHRPNMDKVRPLAVEDGLQAMRTVRRQAGRWGVDPDRLGMLGFSAGGMLRLARRRTTTRRAGPASPPRFTPSGTSGRSPPTRHPSSWRPRLMTTWSTRGTASRFTPPGGLPAAAPSCTSTPRGSRLRALAARTAGGRLDGPLLGMAAE